MAHIDLGKMSSEVKWKFVLLLLSMPHKNVFSDAMKGIQRKMNYPEFLPKDSYSLSRYPALGAAIKKAWDL